MTNPQDNVGIAFLMVFIAGMCTGIGASLVLLRKVVTVANKTFLAGALGLSAGVMLYVTFVEIFQKSLAGFHEAGVSGDASSGLVYVSATLCFFGGVLTMMALDKLVHWLGGNVGHDDPETNETNEMYVPTPAILLKEQELPQQDSPAVQSTDVETGVTAANDSGSNDSKTNDKKLVKMGMMTALAIGLHNFPEGIATFIATLEDPKVGAALAVAIGIHNIPEGLCVSIPIYYATGSRSKALGWALLSGISEPVGALIAYLILMDHLGPMAFGIVFGLVGGMMCYICLHELIPTAHRYDPEDKVTTLSIVLGMAIMATSLVLFVLEPTPMEVAAACTVSNATAL